MREAKGGLGGQEGVSDETRDEVNEEVSRTTVARTLDLTDVFEEIIDGFDDCSFAKQNLF